MAKYVSFGVGSERGYGVIEGEHILRLDTLPDAPPDLVALLPQIADGVDIAMTGAAFLPLRDVQLLPPIPNPAKVLCVATNFREPGMDEKLVPEYPLVFTRFADSITGHDAPLLCPAVSERFDFEGEMAVIIGRLGHKIPRAKAMDHVAGYACFNDGSVRDWQKHSTQFTPGKNFYRTAGFGPWMACRREIPDPSVLSLTTRVNGEVMQAIGLDRMIFDVGWLIAYFSTFTPLSAGDVIVTGTPSGFGATRRPQRFLQPDDVVEVEVTGLGTLRNRVEQDTDPRNPVFPLL